MILGEREDRWVRKVPKSVRKSLFDLGGRYIEAMIVGVGPDSLQTENSKELEAGTGRGETLSFSL